MMFRRPAAAIALCLAWFSLSTQRAKAEVVLAFSPDGQTTSADVFVNDSLSINVYIRDTDVVNPSDPSPTLKSGYGLGKFSFKGTFDSSKLALDLPPPSTSSFTFGSSLGGTAQYAPGAGELTASWSKTGGGVYGDLNQAGAPLLLGTVHFKALTAGTYTLTIDDPDPLAITDFVFGPPNSTAGLDAEIFDSPGKYSFTVNVAAVPEPGSMSLVALASGGLWLARRRMRRAK